MGLRNMEELQPRRGPGRPPKYEVAEQVSEPAQEVGERRVRAVKNPFGQMKQRGAYPERPGFHRHWFNDIPGRVSEAGTGGWSHVQENGKNVSQVCGVQENGQPLIRFLMEIPEEWYKEDMAAQQREVDAKEAAIKRGDLERQPGDNRYVPAQGISIKNG